ncbi:uracil-DNA glycosylase [Mycetocola miduiensis]|nr:uracil-DNA glycosylase [Mycetocola miduiensis]
MSMFLSSPRGFRSSQTRDERLAMLDEVDRVQPLREWAMSVEARMPGRIVPSFDPAEAGVEARTLFVLEAPGPMTNAVSGSRRPGSGFISVDNDDVTAENLWRAREAAGLHSGFLAWNIVRWYLGPASVKPKVAEVAEGAASLLELMRLLPRLETVVLSGRFAQRGWQANIERSLRRPVLNVVETWHPGPKSMNQPGKRADLIAALRGVANGQRNGAP